VSEILKIKVEIGALLCFYKNYDHKLVKGEMRKDPLGEREHNCVCGVEIERARVRKRAKAMITRNRPKPEQRKIGIERRERS
jgi:hypothetical protein